MAVLDNLQEATETIKPLDTEELRRQAHLVIDFICDYYKNIESYPVRSQVEPGYLKKRVPDSAPNDPEPIEHILQDVQNDIVPGLTHWQSPNFFAYFPCNASIPGFLGEMLCTAFNTPGFTWVSSPAATELESIVMDWMGKLLNLPEEFLFSGGGGGVMHGTTCEAILCAVVAARDQMLRKTTGSRDDITKLTVYGSDQTHSAFAKAAKIAGINPNNCRMVPTTKVNAFALTAQSFREAVESDIKSGLVPLFLCATIGTTSCTAVDPLGPLCQVAREYGIWVHVDAAYAGSACICPEYRHFLDGVENVDSFSFNPHKWFLTPLDCCCMWVRDPNLLVKALSTYPEYLRNKASDKKQVVDYKDWGITLTRRFRSLKLWLVLRSYGVANLRKFQRGHIKIARDLEVMIGMDKRFEVVVPRNFSTVCFRIRPIEIGGDGRTQIVSDEEAANNFNAKLVESVNESGQIFMIQAVIGGVHAMRLAIGASLTENRHVNLAWKVVQDHAAALLMDTSS